MQIALLGAGRTSFYLVQYLANQLEQCNWHLTIADYDINQCQPFATFSPRVHCTQLDITHDEKRKAVIAKHDLVISMLPATFHVLVARDCLAFGKHLFTASYIADELKEMAAEIEEKGLLFLNEIGLDPGIDHMSAMQMLDDIRDGGGVVLRFKSYTGGLMEPSLEDNPWQYKFTWNPGYVVTAGRDGGMYLRDGRIKRIPYHRLFTEIEDLHMPHHGVFDAYYNRNSLKYIHAYKLDKVQTVVRYTLRREGFCVSWHPLVNLGLTDNQFELEFDREITHREFLNMFIRKGEGELEDRVAKTINHERDSMVFKKLKWLGLFDNTKIPLVKGTSAQFLQKILEPKWHMQAHERDAIYMAHVCYFTKDGKMYKQKAYMAVEGENREQTAMARTVGLPLAIAVHQFLQGKIKAKGLRIPVEAAFYTPILRELENQGIGFTQTIEEVGT